MRTSARRAGEDAATAVKSLRTPSAVRERCNEIFELGLRGGLRQFELDTGKLHAAANYVVDTIRENYPDLEIPYHSRWRHFAAGGVDRVKEFAGELAQMSPDDRARSSIDLVVTSVLLDAGAGDRWRYRESATGGIYSRSEGLGVASFHLFLSGAFSSASGARLRADAAALANLDRATLLKGFQVSDSNPLVGVDGRVALLNALGQALAEHPRLFGEGAPRIGNLFDFLKARADHGELRARDILVTVLEGLSSIWPGRIEIGGENLGDVWRHPAVRREDSTNGLVPFHKLSQWLTYSLVEPLEQAGLRVTGMNELTGLAEYRNGGLFVDLDVLELKESAKGAEEHDAGSELVVEWRALTVALLDRIAPLVRNALAVNDEAMPLARILEGGSWSAGRRIAAERRAGGGPPIRVRSDGTVF